MAGPLSGVGSGQQIPIAQTFQPGRNIEQNEQSARQRRQDGDTAGVQEAEQPRDIEASNEAGARGEAGSRASEDTNLASASGRGGTIDILV